MSKPVVLPNGRHWKTRVSAIAYFKEMLARYSLDEHISIASDKEDLHALLQHYDRNVPKSQSTKIGAGIDYFSKGQVRGEGFTTECFFVHRIDGSFDDFSFEKAIRS